MINKKNYNYLGPQELAHSPSVWRVVNKRSDSLNIKELKNGMKVTLENWKSKSGFGKPKTNNKPLPDMASYIFVKPVISKTKREQDVIDFLDSEGVFQIHLSIVMKEFKPNNK